MMNDVDSDNIRSCWQGTKNRELEGRNRLRDEIMWRNCGREEKREI